MMKKKDEKFYQSACQLLCTKPLGPMIAALRSREPTPLLVLKNVDERDVAAIAFVLEQNRLIHGLHLPNCRLGQEGAKQLGTALTENHVITTLSFASSPDFGDGNMIDLVAGLKHCQSLALKEMSFNGCSIGLQGLDALVEALVLLPSMGEGVIDLSHNNLPPEAPIILGKLIRSVKGPRVLNLAFNKLGEYGAAALGGAFAADLSLSRELSQGHEHQSASSLPMMNLTSLDLSYNGIGDQGVAKLVEGLMTYLRLLQEENDASVSKRSCPLEELILDGNHITDAGMATSLRRLFSAQAVKNGLTLRRLGIASNPISDDGCESLALALCGKHVQLASLDLRGIPLEAAGIQTLCALVAQNDVLNDLHLKLPGLIDLDLSPQAASQRQERLVEALIELANSIELSNTLTELHLENSQSYVSAEPVAVGLSLLRIEKTLALNKARKDTEEAAARARKEEADLAAATAAAEKERHEATLVLAAGEEEAAAERAAAICGVVIAKEVEAREDIVVREGEGESDGGQGESRSQCSRSSSLELSSSSEAKRERVREGDGRTGNDDELSVSSTDEKHQEDRVVGSTSQEPAPIPISVQAMAFDGKRQQQEEISIYLQHEGLEAAGMIHEKGQGGGRQDDENMTASQSQSCQLFFRGVATTSISVISGVELVINDNAVIGDGSALLEVQDSQLPTGPLTEGVEENYYQVVRGEEDPRQHVSMDPALEQEREEQQHLAQFWSDSESPLGRHEQQEMKQAEQESEEYKEGGHQHQQQQELYVEHSSSAFAEDYLQPQPPQQQQQQQRSPLAEGQQEGFSSSNQARGGEDLGQRLVRAISRELADGIEVGSHLSSSIALEGHSRESSSSHASLAAAGGKDANVISETEVRLELHDVAEQVAEAMEYFQQLAMQAEGGSSTIDPEEAAIEAVLGMHLKDEDNNKQNLLPETIAAEVRPPLTLAQLSSSPLEELLSGEGLGEDDDSQQQQQQQQQQQRLVASSKGSSQDGEDDDYFDEEDSSSLHGAAVGQLQAVVASETEAYLSSHPDLPSDDARRQPLSTNATRQSKGKEEKRRRPDLFKGQRRNSSKEVEFVYRGGPGQSRSFSQIGEVPELPCSDSDNIHIDAIAEEATIASQQSESRKVHFDHRKRRSPPIISGSTKGDDVSRRPSDLHVMMVTTTLTSKEKAHNDVGSHEQEMEKLPPSLNSIEKIIETNVMAATHKVKKTSVSLPLDPKRRSKSSSSSSTPYGEAVLLDTEVSSGGKRRSSRGRSKENEDDRQRRRSDSRIIKKLLKSLLSTADMATLPALLGDNEGEVAMVAAAVKATEAAKPTSISDNSDSASIYPSRARSKVLERGAEHASLPSSSKRRHITPVKVQQQQQKERAPFQGFYTPPRRRSSSRCRHTYVPSPQPRRDLSSPTSSPLYRHRSPSGQIRRCQECEHPEHKYHAPSPARPHISPLPDNSFEFRLSRSPLRDGKSPLRHGSSSPMSSPSRHHHHRCALSPSAYARRCAECESPLHQFVAPKAARPHYSPERKLYVQRLQHARPPFSPPGRNTSPSRRRAAAAASSPSHRSKGPLQAKVLSTRTSVRTSVPVLVPSHISASNNNNTIMARRVQQLEERLIKEEKSSMEVLEHLIHLLTTSSARRRRKRQKSKEREGGGHGEEKFRKPYPEPPTEPKGRHNGSSKSPRKQQRHYQDRDDGSSTTASSSL